MKRIFDVREIEDAILSVELAEVAYADELEYLRQARSRLKRQRDALQKMLDGRALMCPADCLPVRN